MPASPDHVVQSNLVLPSQSDSFEAIPLWRRQLLSGTNSNAHMSYPLRYRLSTMILDETENQISACRAYRKRHFANEHPIPTISRDECTKLELKITSESTMQN